MKNGFSFIGVVIATFIGTMGIMAVFSLSTMALTSARVGEMRLVAAGLAQEGVEIIRGMRDREGDWDMWEWYNGSPMPRTYYLLQYNSTNLSLAAGMPPGAPLRLDNTTGLYQYDIGSQTYFYRFVKLTQVSGDEVKVESEVRWMIPGESAERRLIVEDRLWKWK